MTGPLLNGNEPPAPGRRVRADALERADTAWRVRVAGGTWSEAAKIAGYSNAENAVRAVRETYGSLPTITRDDLRDVWRARLEVLWRNAQRDAAEGKAGAIVAGVRVAQAAAMLDGLNAPSEVVVHSPTTAELEAWVAVVVGEAAPALDEGDIFGAIEG